MTDEDEDRTAAIRPTRPASHSPFLRDGWPSTDNRPIKFPLSSFRLSMTNHTLSFSDGLEETFESYGTNNALFYFSVAPSGATSSPFFALAEGAACPQHAQREAGHIRHHLITGHERIANTGSARNTQVLSRG